MIQTQKEQAAWLPPERLGPVEWTERHRFLPALTSAEPGKFSFTRTPYWREVCATAADSAVREVVVVKPVQVGFSELQRSILAWQIDQEPGPSLFVMPSQDSARELVEERIRPLIESTPIIAAHLSPNPDDFTKSYVRFDSMQLFTGWAGSPQALASRPIRYVNCDEVDKYPPFNGREADPISLVRERTATFGHRSKIYIGSTPTLRSGNVWKAFESCDIQKCYFVPCPHCSHYQRLILPNLKYPDSTFADKQRRAAQIELNNSAYYECVKCAGKILEQHKSRMLNAGLWVAGRLESDGQWVAVQGVTPEGKLDTPTPKAKRVGYWISSLYSPWKSFSAVAAEFVRSQGDMGRMMNFKNSWMAEPFEDQISSTKAGDIEIMAASATAPNIIPAWASLVIATADVQAEGNLCYYVVRAWGPEYKSQLVDFGTVDGVEKLDGILNATYPIGDTDERAGVDMLGIDAKYMPNRVYQFASTDARIYPLIGSSQTMPKQTISVSVGSHQLGVEKREINTNYFKDQLHDRRRSGKWLVHSAITNDYCKQMASEHKVKDFKTGRLVWTPVSQGIANHYWDCETYQQACADIAGVNLIETPDENNAGSSSGKVETEEQETVSLGLF